MEDKWNEYLLYTVCLISTLILVRLLSPFGFFDYLLSLILIVSLVTAITSKKGNKYDIIKQWVADNVVFIGCTFIVLVGMFIISTLLFVIFELIYFWEIPSLDIPYMIEFVLYMSKGFFFIVMFFVYPMYIEDKTFDKKDERQDKTEE